jgi:DNA-binding NarL/FixJ family response regulator
VIQVRRETFAPAHIEDRQFSTHDRLSDAERQIQHALTQSQASVETFQLALDLITELRSLIHPEVCKPPIRPGSLTAMCDWLDDTNADSRNCCTPASVPIARRPDETRGAGLSPREIEILALVVEGRSNKAIALHLFLSVRTVERHINNIYRKIDARNRAEATAFALRHHLI